MPEGLLPGRGGLLLLRMRDHDRRVQVDDDRAAVRAWRRPRPAPRRDPGPRRGRRVSPSPTAAGPRPGRRSGGRPPGPMPPARPALAAPAAPRSARQSPPSATAAARSAMIFPGSCTERGARHRASPADRPCPRPVTLNVSHSRTAPAWDTSPWPSADTATLELRALFFTWKVPSARSGQDLQQALSSQAKGTFYVYGAAPQLFRRKAEANSRAALYSRPATRP